MYHQVNELILNDSLGDEANLLCQHIQTSFTERLMRVVGTFDMLTTSFCVMEDGMK
jgi:tryptophan 2,3-dioxygenase